MFCFGFCLGVGGVGAKTNLTPDSLPRRPHEVFGIELGLAAFKVSNLPVGLLLEEFLLKEI